jgi:serine phosphatase RsbU (regulator of sigma subunit)
MPGDSGFAEAGSGGSGGADGGRAAAALAASALLADAGRRLAGTLNLRRCLRVVVELAVTHLAEVATVVRPPGPGHAPVVWTAAGGRGEECPVPEQEIVALPELAEALTTYPPGPGRRVAPSAVPDWLTGGRGPVGELLVCSLPGNAEPAGALVLMRSAGRAAFSDREQALARTLAETAGAAIAAAELYRVQAEAMAVLQADLRLPPLPAIAGVDLGASHQPGDGSVQVGGDFYDVFPPTAQAGRTVVVLGDVAGKGTPAAGLAGRVRQTLRTLHLLGQDPVAMLRTLNAVLLQAEQSDRFVTLVVGSVGCAAGGGVRLTAATGGHPRPLVLRGDGTVEPLLATGTLVGAVAELTITPAEVTLAPGELCLLYSDGVVEAHDAGGGAHYGEDRLQDALSSCRGMPAAVAVERLRQLVSEWVRGRVPDDLVMLAVRAPDAGA